MYNITLICTHHTEIGKCNSDELFKIIESIRPEVIFEEIPNKSIDMFYKQSQLLEDEPLEVKSIKKYLRFHDIKHIPVDIDASPDLPPSDIDYMFKTFRSYDAYKKLEDEQYFMLERDGFTYLNSDRFSDIISKKIATEKILIDFAINKYQLSRIFKLFYDEHDNRENEMLQNIYNYSKDHSYNNAIFFIGAGHRKTIIQKIKEYIKKESLKLNWTFYGA